jgi:biopolymer transport protein ExbB
MGPKTEESVVELILKGGWVMAPILLGSVAAFALVLERAVYFWKIRLDATSFSQGIYALVEKGNIKDAESICKKTNHPLAAVFAAGLEYPDGDPVELDRVMEREGSRQVGVAERNLNYLVVIVGVEPLLGFLGTILGLIQAFMAWEKFSEAVTVSQLAGGIYQAMITTAAGLLIAIPYFVVYHVFLSRVNRLAHEINHYGDHLVGILARSKRYASKH